MLVKVVRDFVEVLHYAALAAVEQNVREARAVERAAFAFGGEDDQLVLWGEVAFQVAGAVVVLHPDETVAVFEEALMLDFGDDVGKGQVVAPAIEMRSRLQDARGLGEEVFDVEVRDVNLLHLIVRDRPVGLVVLVGRVGQDQVNRIRLKLGEDGAVVGVVEGGKGDQGS